jgi:hypothetical protein
MLRYIGVELLENLNPGFIRLPLLAHLDGAEETMNHA